MKFKVGDRIKVDSTCTGGGKFGVITSSRSDSNWYVIYDDGKNDLHSENCLELVNPERKEEKVQFKIGDTVKVVDTSCCIEGLLSKGYMGTIEQGAPGSWLVGEYYLCEKNIELISAQEEEKPKYTFGPFKVRTNEFVEPGKLYFLNDNFYAPIKSRREGILSIPKKTMSTLAKIAKKLLDADTKVLVEAGYLDSELELTDEGEDQLLTMLFLTYKEELATEARKQLKDAKGRK